MTIDDGTLYRAAGISAAVAIVAFVISGVALALFFGGAGQVWGPVNDVFIAIWAIALLLPMLAVDRIAGPQTGIWLRIVTVAAIAGAILAAVGQLLLVVGVIDLQTSYVTGGIGIVPVLVWMVALVVLAGPMHRLPRTIGWLAGGAVVLVVVGLVITAVTTGPPSWVAWLAVAVVFVLWMGSMATSFLGRATA
jgi:hypothetical protein